MVLIAIILFFFGFILGMAIYAKESIKLEDRFYRYQQHAQRNQEEYKKEIEFLKNLINKAISINLPPQEIPKE